MAGNPTQLLKLAAVVLAKPPTNKESYWHVHPHPALKGRKPSRDEEMTLMTHRRSIAVAACAMGAAIAAPTASGAGTVAHKANPVVKKVQVSDHFYNPTKVTIRKRSSVN